MDAGWLTSEAWDGADKEGVLGQMVGIFSKAKENRYVRLKESRLFIFEGDTEDSDEVEAHIPLGDVEVFTTQSFVTKYGPFCFCIYSKRQNQRYFLIAASADEKDDWVEAITHAAAASLSRSPSEGSLLGEPTSQKSPRSRKLSKAATSGGEAIRTLFITGFPMDVKEREVHNMFRLLPGYEGCKINFGEQPVAFVAFTDIKLAQNARRLLNGVRFDPFAANPVRITYAKQNSKSKSLPAEFYPHWNDPDEDGKASSSASTSSSTNASRRASASQGSDRPPGSDRNTRLDTVTIEKLKSAFTPDAPVASPKLNTLFEDNPASEKLSATPPSRGFGAIGVEVLQERRKSSDTDGGAPLAGLGASPSNSSIAPACSTLFVGNLHPEVTEPDLTQLFSLIPGFRQVKLYVGHDNLPVCFVEYTDDSQSTMAMQSLRGVYLGPTRLRIEYARSKMSAKGTGSGVHSLSSSGSSRKHSQSSIPHLDDPSSQPSPQYFPPPQPSDPRRDSETSIPLLATGKLSFGSLF